MPVLRTRLLDVPECAWLLNASPSWVSAASRAGRLPGIKVGRFTRFRIEDLEKYLDEQRATADAATGHRGRCERTGGPKK